MASLTWARGVQGLSTPHGYERKNRMACFASAGYASGVDRDERPPEVNEMTTPTVETTKTETTTLTDDERWAAVVARDSRYDGRFVVAVRSTGIYCKPSCASRRPLRENVRFFAAPAEAAASGFRPGLRCEPEKETASAVELVERARAWIEAQDDGPVRLAALGQALGVSPYHLQRTFRRLTGVTPREYGESCRLARLKARLKAGEDVTSALHASGFGSSSRLYERARAELGMTPRAYRRGGEGAVIRYDLAESALGWLLVGATEHGVCFVALGDGEEEMAAILRAEYPAAEIRRDRDGLAEWTRDLLARVSGQGGEGDLPLDVQGTEFQRRVWDALRGIPRGTTRTYTQVAESIGEPRAVRAVARACATNPVSVVVPCHRVVQKGGSLAGYRWGIDRKRALLERVARAAG